MDAHRSFNIPLPPGSGTEAYLYALEKLVAPALRRFKPDVIIVPSGTSLKLLNIRRQVADSTARAAPRRRIARARG